jgi:hypothetical protein
MRTKTLLLTAALSAAGIATSMAQVYSVNAVGYVNTTLVPGFSLVSNPLNNTTGNTVQNLFGNGIQGTIPNLLTVYHYDPTADRFQVASYDDIALEFIGEGATAVIPPGTGVFVRNPSTTALTCTFVGEVPQGEASNITIPQGFSIKGSTVPIAGTASPTSLNVPGQQGDTLYEWDPAGQRYVAASYDDIVLDWISVQPGGGSPTIDVGEAFFIFKTAAQSWDRNFQVNP